MDFDDIYRLLRSLWLVWLLVVFVGIIAWVMWPRRKKELEEQAMIPFKDDDSE
jgi:cytochrome c oxidase cbb3-type subunit IV